MSITLSPVKADYLARVALGLADLAPEDRDEVLQDLEAHLAELSDDTLDQVLGTPGRFIEEFRQSAGLDTNPETTGPWLIDQSRAWLESAADRIGGLAHWAAFRSAWIWIRGWLVVVGWSFVYDVEGFSYFPIPSVSGSSLVGLLLVVAATWLSLWLAEAKKGPRAFGSVALSLTGGVALVGMLLNPMPTYDQMVEVFKTPCYYDQLMAPDGTQIENIYAYDMDGQPVEVLLYNQEGLPLVTVSNYVCVEAEFDPTSVPCDYGNGRVTFVRDQDGTKISNLYPLELEVYDSYGSLQPMAPPSVAFPSVDNRADQTPSHRRPWVELDQVR